MTPDPGHVSASPDVQDGRHDLSPITAVIEPAIRADERLRFLDAAKDFPEPYRTIIVRTANRGTPAGILMVSDRRSAAVTAAGRTTHRCVCRICGEAYDVTDSKTAREGPGEVARAGPC